MKTKLVYLMTNLFVVLFLVVVITVKAVGSEAPKVKVIPFEDEKAVVAIESIYKNVTELSIEDENGYMLYYREGNIEDPVYSKVFDFMNLRNGEYNIIVKSTAGDVVVGFEVADGKVIVEDSKDEYKPFFDYKDGVLKLSYLNYSKDDVELNLVSEYGVVYEKSLGKEFAINTGLDLGLLDAGEYAVMLKSGNKSYKFNFEK